MSAEPTAGDRIDVVLVNRNSGPMLRECLASLASDEHRRTGIARVTVVDDGSSDGSAANLHDLDLPVVVLRNETHRGYGYSCNRAAAGGTSPYILFLNTDVIVPEGTLDAMMARVGEADPSAVGIFGIALCGGDGRRTPTCARFPTPARLVGQCLGLDRIVPRLVPGHLLTEWDHAQTRPVDQVIGAFMLMRRDLFERLGGYDERFFVYMEDLDLSLRAAREGYATLFLHEPHAVHLGGATANKAKAESLFFNRRSRIQYCYKHFGAASATLVAGVTLVVEPVTRLAYCLARRSGADAAATLRAYGRLWKWVLARAD